MDDESEMKVDFTPMIDCVFNLLIFFMVVIKLTNDDFEPVELPKAEQAEVERIDDPNRITISLAKIERPQGGALPYKVVIGGEDMTPKKSDEKAWLISNSRLELFLRAEAKLAGDRGFSERQVLIRSDKECPYEYVAMIMQTLARPGIRMYRVQLGSEKVSTNEGEGRKGKG